MVVRWTWSNGWRRLLLGVTDPRRRRLDRLPCDDERTEPATGLGREEARAERTLETFPPVCLWRP